MISQEFVEELKFRNPIEDVVSSYVNLKKSGSNMVGLCPFHSEKSGSFTVFGASHNFYCFGCGAGGDVITFIMKAENLDYPSAVEFLAKRCGMTMPDDSEKQYGDGIKKERLWEMNKEAAKFFRNCLYQNENAKRYVFEKRKLQQRTVNRFGLGFAPDSFNALTDYMHSLGYNDMELVEGFLCGISQKSGRTYDKFRNRIMFPIIDIFGNVIAFGGRVLDDSKPKYLNSSETRIFKKSRNLFALNYAKDKCQDNLILCEGYMDVIALHEAGFENAIATLGTALTSDQARIMRKYTKKVIICYDSDNAGQAASNKAFGLLGEAGVETRILQVEGAKDPDEYIKKYGPERFRQLLNGSRTEFDFKFAQIVNDNDITQTDGKLKAASQVCELISAVPSAVERDVYIGRVSDKLGIPKDALSIDVKRLISRNAAAAKKAETRNLLRSIEQEGGQRRLITDANDMRIIKSEQAIIGILILHPELYGELDAVHTVTPDDFITEFGKKCASELLGRLSGGESFNIGSLGEDFSESDISRITRMVIDREKLGKNDVGVLCDCIDALKSEKTASELDISEIIKMKREKFNNKD